MKAKSALEFILIRDPHADRENDEDFYIRARGESADGVCGVCGLLKPLTLVRPPLPRFVYDVDLVEA